MNKTELTPCVKWTPDCQGKWDYDGRLVSISTRYWPSGGGFHTLDSSTGEFRLSTNPAIRPSATASILLNHGEPDQYGYGDSTTLAKKSFEGDTEAQVKSAVETWVAEKFAEVSVLLRSLKS